MPPVPKAPGMKDRGEYLLLVLFDDSTGCFHSQPVIKNKKPLLFCKRGLVRLKQAVTS